MPSRKRVKQLALWLVVAALISSPFVLSLVQRQGSRGEKPSPTQLMARAAMYANESLYALTDALSLSKPDAPTLQIDAQGARNVSETLVAEAADMPVTGFAGLIRRAMISYAELANASAPAMLAAPRLYRGFVGAEKALQALESCNVEDYLAKYGKARNELLRAESGLREALDTLADMNTSLLLSPLHEEVAQNLSIAVAKSVAAIIELENLYKIVANHSDVIKALCSGKKVGKQELLPLLRALAKLHPGRAGPLGYDEAEAIAKLTALAQIGGKRGHQGSGVSNGSSGQGGGGTGAGYRKPSSDD